MKALTVFLAYCICLVVLPTLAYTAENRILGLLTLPQVLGHEPCESFTPKEIPVFADFRQANPVAVIYVEKNWQYPEEGGGCSGLQVKSKWTGNEKTSGDLPLREYDYEKPAAIVVEKREGWFKILLSFGTGWIYASSQNRYFSLEQLLSSHHSYLTKNWDGHLYQKPKGKFRKITKKDEVAVKIISALWIEDQLWFKIKIPLEDECGNSNTISQEINGWVPAYSKDRETILWFYSRGC